MRIIFIISIILSVMGCTSATTDEKTSSPQYLTVLHTNDNHGRFWHNEKGEYGMAARKTLLDQLRSEAKKKGHGVLLLSGGDINTGIPESDLQYAEPDFKGMSLLGYDAMALGNHEFDNPLSVLEKQQTWANFPLLSANIIEKSSGKNAFTPYKIFEKNGLSIAVIGLTTTDTAKIGNPQYIGHLEFKDPVSVTAKLAEEIKVKYNPDITIAVTHMGHFIDANHGINAPGDVTLARSLPTNTLDMIIGGHSQEPVCMASNNVNDDNFKPGLACKPDQQNGTWIMQAHEWGKYVGKAEFKLENGELSLLDYKLMPVNLYVEKTQTDGTSKEVLANEYIKPDPALKAFLAKYQAIGAKQIEGSIGSVDARLEGDRNKVRYQQTNLARVIIQAQMNVVGADFGLISGGGIRSSINAGEISYKDILKVHPFKNRITYMDWQGAELWDYLNTVTSFPADAGAYLQYHKLSFERKDDKLTNVFINGKPFDKNKTYRMSLNSYNASGGDGYPTINTLKGFVSTDETDAQALKTFISQHSPIKAAEFAPK
ncbi:MULTISPECIES: bifunctional UDP-sugar hydrolase/5'-nucleotidase UshA [unclassified Pseudoalteromonas]|uniref:bifunctional UDP-sugar hydrolase/5'-nucleotidase UshA n=1 Tax=unclassified Pseudoalteromonas TaxID=194690 RepID=UPI0011084016|nr:MULTISPECIES: bifunctional UDP-sugar hydrolase/5'-nucleotidase UshA [unclassified Pseudoalteromonas]TMN83241.1 bifunctional UDP-sugar hydrolase/5'-nucleotidase [Pseudoalteromonas sp. S410]TMN89963.1 bifunctional UDP-sugar hydrolase/5'-nucleotidase [Pseudoalteromonas sp. S408]TMN96934.1 bifunctional UDP-sugar hydrolase/5'-nucleotidase [Pseudoalteromonas sp. S409]TMN97045.1 bifunctional UDP-sugar hydrolase/5'-nucleotidase [Pseudoalteromonas sp. S407]TMO12400.1 bifunctional UDP-sugar hydrolase